MNRRTRAGRAERGRSTRRRPSRQAAGLDLAAIAAAPAIFPETLPSDPVSRSTARQTSSRTGALDLRTVQSLRSLVDSLRRVSGLLGGLLKLTSPVSKGMRRLQGRGRRLHLQETVQLGEKRFVAILRVDDEQFLIGGSASGVSLLASLAPASPSSPPEPAPAWPEHEDGTSFGAVLAAHRHDGDQA